MFAGDVDEVGDNVGLGAPEATAGAILSMIEVAAIAMLEAERDVGREEAIASWNATAEDGGSLGGCMCERGEELPVSNVPWERNRMQLSAC